MDIDLIKKYFNNSCSEEELQIILAWFADSAKTTEGKALLFKLWEELPDEDGNLKTDFAFILDKIHHKVNLDQSKKLLEKSYQNPVKYKRRKYFKKLFSKAAAILLFPVFGLGLYMTCKYQTSRHSQISVNQAYNEIYSSVDAITKVTLPDGSSVWLNHRSTLKYPAMFHGDSRTVELTGEGYFEVTHDPKMPFFVKTGKIQIKAVGTTFNIMAYPDEDRIETSLINGKVELQMIRHDGKPIPLVQMKPAELAVFQKSNSEISTRNIPDDRYFAWKDGKLVFNEEPMVEVVEKLSRWFNVDIEIKDPELVDLTYTATFVNETLPQVMELISLVSPVSYSISNRQMVSPGIFSKRKVILSYRNK